jgi:DNA replication protein DnaC
MTEAPQILLNHRLKSLRLPTVLREYGKLARQAAAEGLDHVQFLARLIELEMIDRERRMIERRMKAAKFPAVKSLDSFDFKAIPALNKMQVLELARCEWVERRENVIALGPSGTGKTHIALGLGLSGINQPTAHWNSPCRSVYILTGRPSLRSCAHIRMCTLVNPTRLFCP